jgi:hypothetical protein
MQMGIFAAITQSLDEAVAAKLAEKHGFIWEIQNDIFIAKHSVKVP